MPCLLECHKRLQRFRLLPITWSLELWSTQLYNALLDASLQQTNVYIKIRKEERLLLDLELNLWQHQDLQPETESPTLHMTPPIWSRVTVHCYQYRFIKISKTWGLDRLCSSVTKKKDRLCSKTRFSFFFFLLKA